MSDSEHLRPIRLFDISQGKVEASESESQHLRECEECQNVIAVFARQFAPQNQPRDKADGSAA